MCGVVDTPVSGTSGGLLVAQQITVRLRPKKQPIVGFVDRLKATLLSILSFLLTSLSFGLITPFEDGGRDVPAVVVSTTGSLPGHVLVSAHKIKP